MAKTLAEVLTDVRTLTNHDNDQQISDVQLTSLVNDELADVRRMIGEVAPTLYLARTTFTITVAANNFTAVPADFEAVYLVERLGSDGNYYPIEAANPLNPNDTAEFAFMERGATVEIFPSSNPLGSYRLTYVTKPTKLAHPGDAADTIEVPQGFESVVAERVAARVRRRFNEMTEAAAHAETAAQIWKEQKAYLTRRTGVHPTGFRPKR